MSLAFERPDVSLYLGECRAVMAELPADSVDAIVTDPPYGLEFMGKEWDKLGATVAPFAEQIEDGRVNYYGKGNAPFGGGGQRVRYGASVKSMQSWHEVWAREALRLLKPGAHLVAFGGTRTHHRLTCALEDAGFEIRDCLMWLYGQGFPKSLDVGKAIDKAAGALETQSQGANYAGGDYAPRDKRFRSDYGFKYTTATDAARAWDGWGTALKPSWEPIVLARKPLGEATVAANVLKWGTGALNIDGSRIGSAGARSNGGNGKRDTVAYGNYGGTERIDYEKGRWPANLILSHSPGCKVAGQRPNGWTCVPECAVRLLDAQSGELTSGGVTHQPNRSGYGYRSSDGGTHVERAPDTGSASRFFYTSKASREDRITRSIGEVTIEWTSASGPSKAVLQVDTEQSPAKVTDVSGFGDANEWSTFLFGSTITDLCRRGSRSTTSARTSSPTPLKTWSALTRLLTSASTADADSLTASGGSPVGSAASSDPSLTITLSEAVSLPGASPALSGTPLTISASERRHGHPTVKPLDLMKWLVRLVAPPGALILDPFMGSGSTVAAARALGGYRIIGIDQDPASVEDAIRRLRQEVLAL